MHSRRNVSSLMLVVCLFRDLTKFLRLCSRLEKKNSRKGRTGKKKVAEFIRTHVTRIELCLTQWQGQAVSGSRNKERERESCLRKSK